MPKRIDLINDPLPDSKLYKLNPIQKEQRIERLKQEANENFREAFIHGKKFLIYALHCGEALLEIKLLLKHGDFQKWIDGNFVSSYETANVYMGVAKHWSDVRIAKMREKGITIDSIKGFYDALRGKPYFSKQRKQEDKYSVVDEYREWILYEFKRELSDLDKFKPWFMRYKVFMLGNHFHYFWSKLYIELKKLAAEVEAKAERKIKENKAQDMAEKLAIRQKARKAIARKYIYR